MKEAEQLHANKRYPEAEQKYLEVLKLDPANVVILSNLAACQLEQNRFTDAEAAALVDQLRSAKRRLTQLLLGVTKDFSPEARERRETEKSKLVSEVEQLEGRLARHVTILDVRISCG